MSDEREPQLGDYTTEAEYNHEWQQWAKRRIVVLEQLLDSQERAFNASWESALKKISTLQKKLSMYEH